MMCVQSFKVSHRHRTGHQPRFGGGMGGVREAIWRELETSLHTTSHREMDAICY